MAGYAGSALYLQWIHSGGTLVLSADFQTLTTSPSVDIYDDTGGSDAYKSYVAGVKDDVITVEVKGQTSGSATLAALLPGSSGTIIVSPEGTATGKIKDTYPAICLGASRNQPYNDVVRLSVSFQQNGTPTINGSW